MKQQEKEALAKLMASALIRHFEGFRSTPYLCPAGKVTVGFGHVIQPGEEVKEITLAEGASLLKNDIEKALNGIKACLPADVFEMLSDNQLAALIDFVYNIGVTAFSVSTLRRKLIEGWPLAEVAAEFERWVYAGGQQLPGLVERRKAEKELFLSGGKDEIQS